MTLHIILGASLYAIGIAFCGILGFRVALALGRHWADRRGRFFRARSASQGLATLADLYARGEISAQEYAERKEVLGK